MLILVAVAIGFKSSTPKREKSDEEREIEEELAEEERNREMYSSEEGKRKTVHGWNNAMHKQCQESGKCRFEPSDDMNGFRFVIDPPNKDENPAPYDALKEAKKHAEVLAAQEASRQAEIEALREGMNRANQPRTQQRPQTSADEVKVKTKSKKDTNLATDHVDAHGSNMVPSADTKVVVNAYGEVDAVEEVEDDYYDDDL